MIKCGKNGIYGIYVVDEVMQKEELIYVGKTGKSFEERFQGHLRRLNDKNNRVQMKLYNRIRQARRAGLQVVLKPIIQLDEVMWNKKEIREQELAIMEITLIDLLKPECNWEGVQANYLFGYERIKRDEQFSVSCK